MGWGGVSSPFFSAVDRIEVGREVVGEMER